MNFFGRKASEIDEIPGTDAEKDYIFTLICEMLLNCKKLEPSDRMMLNDWKNLLQDDPSMHWWNQINCDSLSDYFV